MGKDQEREKNLRMEVTKKVPRRAQNSRLKAKPGSYKQRLQEGGPA